MKDIIGRRDFLKKAARTAAGGICAGFAHSHAHAQSKTASTAAIPVRTLGKTQVKLPILGYGGAGLPKVWGNPLSHEDRVKLVRYAYDRGIRYFDTAGNYMESQPILGEALQDVRDDIYLVSKVETTNPAWVRMSVEKCLKELRTDRLDAILIHGTPGIEQMTVARAMKIHAELVKLRDEKITRFIGLSAHSYFDKAFALISSGGFDQCMLAYGYIARGHNQLFSERMIGLRNDCIARAHELGMGIVAMKVIGAGVLGAWSGYIVPGYDPQRLKQLPGAAIRYVLKDKRIHMLAIGMRLTTDIDANIHTLASDTKYTARDRTLLADFSSKALQSAPLKAMRID